MDTNDQQRNLRIIYDTGITAIKNNVASEFVLIGGAVGVVLAMIYVEWLRAALFFLLAGAFLFFALLLAFKLIRKQQLGLMEIRRQLQDSVPHSRIAYSVNIAWIMLVIAAAAGTGYYFWAKDAAAARFKETMTEIDSMRKTYSEVMKTEVPKKLGDFDYMESVGANASFTVNCSNYKDVGYYNWKEHAVITLYASDDFDKLSDNKQYEYLCDFARQAGSSVSAVEKECLPEYGELIKRFREQVEKNDETVMWDDDDDYYIVTSNNRYQYADNVKDYFLLNGKDHFTTKHWDEYHKAHPKTTPKPTPKPTSTSKKKSSSNKGTGSSKKKNANPYQSYDNGYDDIYYDDDYDWDRYWKDQDYADGVDDAMEDVDW